MGKSPPGGIISKVKYRDDNFFRNSALSSALDFSVIYLIQTIRIRHLNLNSVPFPQGDRHNAETLVTSESVSESFTNFEQYFL